MVLRKERVIINILGFMLPAILCGKTQMINIKKECIIFKKHDDENNLISSSLNFMNNAASGIESNINAKISPQSNYLLIQKYRGFGNDRSIVIMIKSEKDVNIWSCIEWIYSGKNWEEIREFSLNLAPNKLCKMVPPDGKYLLKSLVQDGHLFLFSLSLNSQKGHSAVYGSVQEGSGIPESTKELLKQVWSNH